MSVVCIPVCSSLDRLARNDRSTGFTDRVVEALVHPAGHVAESGSIHIDTKENAKLAFLVYLGKKWEGQFKKASEILGHLLLREKMDPVSTFSMWSSANVNYTQQREIARHLKVWYSRSLICSEIVVKKILGSDYVQPKTTGIFLLNKEKIPWSCKHPVKVLKHYLAAVYQCGEKTKHQSITHVDCLLSIDHGKGFSRAVAVFVCRTKDKDTGCWTEFQYTFVIASAECKKDSETIIASTFIPLLNEGYAELVKSKTIQVYEKQKGETKDYYCALQGEEEELIGAEGDSGLSVVEEPQVDCGLKLKVGEPIVLQCFFAADIKQFMMNQGRARFASCWCPYCNVAHSKWQKKEHTKGTPWTLARLKCHVEKIKGETDANKRLGCDNQPVFTAIDTSHQVPPILHMESGTGNKIGGEIKEEVQASCEVWTERYVALETRYAQMTYDLSRLEKGQKAYGETELKKEVALDQKSKTNPLIPKERQELKNLQKRKATLEQNLESNKSANGLATPEYENGKTN